METWTRNEEGEWRRWSHPGLGLDAMASGFPRVVAVLVVGLGPHDDEQLLASIRLARRLADRPIEVIAGSVHPTSSWLESVKRAGADQALFASPREGCRCEDPPLEDAVELADRICPELHVRRYQNVTLSVCGRRNDLMVLARYHLDRWCLATKEECPRWHGETRA